MKPLDLIKEIRRPSVGTGQQLPIDDGFALPEPAKPKRTPNQAAKHRRTKGATAEREIKDRFRDVMAAVEEALGIKGGMSEGVKRNTLQSDRGGDDIAGVPLVSIEVKRHETPNLNAWWQQTTTQAKDRELPVLFWRKSREAWRCTTYACLTDANGNRIKYIRATFEAEQFFVYYAELYRRWLVDTARG